MGRYTYREPRTSAELFEQIRNDYAAMRSSRFRKNRIVPGNGASADYHYRSDADYLRLLEYSRDMYRNDGVVQPLIERATRTTLMGGFSLDIKTGDDRLDDDLTARWLDWSEDPDQCDLAGEMSFADQEYAVDRAMKLDGDIFPLGTEDGALELVESHRCRTPSNTKKNVIHGVMLDDKRRRLQYWFTRDDIDPNQPLKNVRDIVPYDTRDVLGGRQVFHVYDSRRVSQTRGVTALAPIFDAIGMVEDINLAKLIQQQVVSCFAILKELPLDFVGSTDGDQIGERTLETQADGSIRTIEGMSPGVMLTGKPGVKYSGFSPNVPNPEFFAHMKFVLTLVSINLGLPLIAVLMDASETNYSGWRGAWDQAKIWLRRNQQILIGRFHRPVYLWKLRQWIADDPAIRSASNRLKATFFKHAWTPPAWDYIDPLKDAQADLMQVRSCQTSPRRSHARRNQDFWDVTDETIQDNAYAIRAAKKEAAAINEAFDDGNPVHWREVISLPLPEGMTLRLDTGSSAEPATAGAATNE